MPQNKLWQQQVSPSTLVEKFTTGDDLLLDQNLVLYDIYGSLAHAQMLANQKLLSVQHLKEISQVLLQLKKKYEQGDFQLQAGDEDVHTRIENEIAAVYPEAGANLHIGRSRNDQVLTDLRLYSKTELLTISDLVLDLIAAFLHQAKKEAQTPMPGYTHMQPAMLSSVGLWLAQFAESLLDDLQILQVAYELNDQSPLGSGAAYGVSLPINRQMTAKLLGFSKIQNNALYCQNSRGKFESLTVHALVQVMHTLGRFAADLLLFTTAEFNFFTFPVELTTGSSIMPQKKNYDVLELLRAKEKTVLSHEMQISAIISGLPSGYNRDLQELKKPYFASFEIAKQSLQVVKLLIEKLQVNYAEMKNHVHPEIFSAHWTYQVMKAQQLPFRQAYFYVKKHLNEMPAFSAATVLQQTNSQGAAGQLQLDQISKIHAQMKQKWQRQKHSFNQTLSELIIISQK